MKTIREEEENNLPQMKQLFFLYVWLNLTRILPVFKESLVKHIRKRTIQTGRLFFSSSLTLLLAVLISCSTFGQSFKKSICEHRKTYKEAFKEESSPLQPEEIRYLRFFKPDETYRTTAAFTRTPYEEPFDMVTSSGKMKKYVKYGDLSFDIKGEPHTLEVYQSIRLRAMPQYKDYLFIPFKDTTNGVTTYGAGRYLDIEIPDIQDGKLTLDFNKTYNPYCAFKDGYNCPRPPVANHLEIAIEAGEKQYAKK